MSESHPVRWLGLLLAVFVLVAGSAMLRTSTTFDEIVFAAAGARGLHTGDYSMVEDHPRLPNYLYGLPVVAAGARLPDEAADHWSTRTRYAYARALFWGAGNDAQRLALWTRAVGLLLAALTVAATFAVARAQVGDLPALLAAGLVAFTPDFLAHAGVAYTDVPSALAMLLGVYALDAMVRRPGARAAAVAGLACAFALALKHSALILAPVLAILAGMEALSGRARDPAWRRALLVALAVLAATIYAALAIVYLGDWTLHGYRDALDQFGRRASEGRMAYLLGESRFGGWWYFFPVAFALKTPLALHVLMVLAAIGAWRAAGGATAWLTHGARAPAVAALLFLAALFTSGMNIGTRHALPLVPFACILVAHGLAPWIEQGAARLRLAIGAVAAAFAVSALGAYPYFFSYLSEYAAGRTPSETLVDSNTDWGQGLVALRDFMRERGIDRIGLAYFGSAIPEGYGIAYIPLPSFLALPPQAEAARAPRYVAVSATLLAGLYVAGDPYAALRELRPAAIVGGSLYVFDRQSLQRRP